MELDIEEILSSVLLTNSSEKSDTAIRLMFSSNGYSLSPLTIVFRYEEKEFLCFLLVSINPNMEGPNLNLMIFVKYFFS